jgi:hypothetical protein
MRQVVEVCDLHETPQREAAQQLGLTLGALEVRLHRARRQLRRLLNGELREMATALGILLDRDELAGWRETREWCHLCGRQQMRAFFEAQPDGRISFRLRCPTCSPKYDIDIHSSFGIVPLDGLRSIRPALKHTILHINTSYAAVLASEQRACLVCGRPQMRVLSIEETEHAPHHHPSWQFQRPHCGFSHAVWAGGVVALANPSLIPQAERFIQAHPRWIMLPPRPGEYAGTPATIHRIGDALSTEQFSMVVEAHGLRLLAVLPN